MSTLIDAFYDTLKIIPFLYLSFLAIEYFEHHSTEKLAIWLEKSKKIQVIPATFFGLLPSCGMPVAATSLFSANIISLSTLISIYLASSDEAFIYLLSSGNVTLLTKIIVIKLLLAIFWGFMISLLFTKQQVITTTVTHQHDECNENIFLAAFNHAIKIIILLLIINAVLSLFLDTDNLAKLSNLLLNNSLLQPVLTAVVGLIPNCTISVLFAHLYLNSLISFPSLISGLLSTTGSSIILLVRSPVNAATKLKIILIQVACSALSGVVLSFFTFS